MKARELKIGMIVLVPGKGWREITFISKSRRYSGHMRIQWAFTPGESCEIESHQSTEFEVAK